MHVPPHPFLERSILLVGRAGCPCLLACLLMFSPVTGALDGCALRSRNVLMEAMAWDHLVLKSAHHEYYSVDILYFMAFNMAMKGIGCLCCLWPCFAAMVVFRF